MADEEDDESRFSEEAKEDSDELAKLEQEAKKAEEEDQKAQTELEAAIVVAEIVTAGEGPVTNEMVSKIKDPKVRAIVKESLQSMNIAIGATPKKVNFIVKLAVAANVVAKGAKTIYTNTKATSAQNAVQNKQNEINKKYRIGGRSGGGGASGSWTPNYGPVLNPAEMRIKVKMP